ncbi:MAG TPA: hypothetical protein VGE52_05725, partial [Pirellulales bacterium]
MNTTDPAPVPEDDDVPNDSWFARNVLWVMPLLFITPLAFFLCVCGGPVFFLLLDSQEREPWLTIMKTLRDSPEVRAKLGEPIDSASLVPLGQIQRTGENAASGM